MTGLTAVVVGLIRMLLITYTNEMLCIVNSMGFVYSCWLLPSTHVFVIPDSHRRDWQSRPRQCLRFESLS